MSKTNNKVELNIEEVKDFQRHIIANNRFLQENGKNPAAVEIEGESGLGKTSTILQLAKEMGLHCVKLNLAQIEELGDLVGFPTKEYLMLGAAGKPELVDGKLKPAEKQEMWVNEKMTDDYVRKGFTFAGKTRMSYCPPEWIANKQGGGILVLDDWNRADIRFIQAVMELVDRQEYISWRLPKDWHIVLTANPDDGRYLVNSIDIAQRTRFISVSLKFDIKVWARWAELEKVDSRCINFMLMHHHEVVTDSANPRSITNFYNAISSLDDFAKYLPLVQKIGDGSVGPEFSALFTMFVNNQLDKLVSSEELMFGDFADAVKKFKSSTGRVSAKDYRADIASCLTTRLVNFILIHAEKNPVSDDIIKRLDTMLTDDELLSNDLKYVLARALVNGNKAKFTKLMMNPLVIKAVAQ